MPQINFQIQTKVDVNQIISAKELKSIFLGGLPLDKLDMLSDDSYDFFINAAADFIEQELTVKLNKTIVSENKDFNFSDWNHWSHLAVTYPAVKVISLEGFLGTTKQTTYPPEWVLCKKSTDGKLYNRSIHLVPTQNSSQSQLIVFSGIMPNAGFFASNAQIPFYWEVKYATGFDVIPPIIKQVIGMTAAIQILLIISDLIVKGSKNYPGIGFGVSSNSISLDGLSQSSGTYVNGQSNVFSAKIKLYQDQLLNTDKGLLQSLRDFYGGIIFSSC